MGRSERARKEELEGLNEIFLMSDADASGKLDKDEFMAAVQRDEVHYRLVQLELPVQDASRLFSAIDGDGSRSLTMKEFIHGCTKLKGPAQSKDLLAIQAQGDTLAKKIESLGQTLCESERMMNALDEVTMRIQRRFDSAVRGTRKKIAHSKGGSEPVVPPKKVRPGKHQDLDLSTGNRPAMPNFPNFVN